MSAESYSVSEDSTYGSRPGKDDGLHAKVIESGQIGFRLAEEIRSLREELLDIKQEKRILMVNNQSLEEEILKAKSTISDLSARIEHLQVEKHYHDQSFVEKENAIRKLEDEVVQRKREKGQMKELVVTERRKNRLLGEELEKSLQDEVALRSYCRELEQRCAELTSTVSEQQTALRAVQEQRHKIVRLVDQCTHYHVLQSKRLEALDLSLVEVPGGDADGVVGGAGPASAALEQHAVSEYYESLLNSGYRSYGGAPNEGWNVGVAGGGEGGSGSGNDVHLDYIGMENRLRSADHQMNQHINSIRSHAVQLQRRCAKSRRHLRSLLEVVRSYEDLLPADSRALSAASLGSLRRSGAGTDGPLSLTASFSSRPPSPPATSPPPSSPPVTARSRPSASAPTIGGGGRFTNV